MNIKNNPTQKGHIGKIDNSFAASALKGPIRLVRPDNVIEEIRERVMLGTARRVL